MRTWSKKSLSAATLHILSAVYHTFIASVETQKKKYQTHKSQKKL